jgi:hypothetical protein
MNQSANNPTHNSSTGRRRHAAMTVLAMTMIVAGTAEAAERESSRPSASRAGAGSIRFAETRDSSHTRRHAIPVADWADRDRADWPAPEIVVCFGNATPILVADRADRDHADGPYTGIVHPPLTCGWNALSVETASADRAADALVEGTFRAFADPFGIWADESDIDDDREDAKDSAGDGRPACDPMDRDVDGDVDFDDLKSLFEAFGTDDGDLDGDGIVSGSDLGLMLARMSLPHAAE